ncbi:MAG: rhomboid family intramembrane serine protease [Alphaproteobacteria bacterium]|nr:rhomboid family intramembrane serine protease [Alphaproteobacteria bacterium]
MVIPIYDNDPLEKSHRAYVTFVLIALNIAIYAVQASASDTTETAILLNFALFPAAVTGDAVTGGFMPPALSLVTYMFLHGGWMHVLSNMLFLWVFADNIEDALGHGRFLVFYLLCGIAGGAAHMLAAPQSTVPLVGASGAIAGVIAAYLMIRPCAKVTVLLFGFVPVRLASYWVLGFWILSQVWHVFSLEKSDTAWWAHVGGLVAGAILVTIMRPAGVILFECMRPEDVVAVEQAAAGTPAGPWSAPR